MVHRNTTLKSEKKTENSVTQSQQYIQTKQPKRKKKHKQPKHLQSNIHDRVRSNIYGIVGCNMVANSRLPPRQQNNRYLIYMKCYRLKYYTQHHRDRTHIFKWKYKTA